MNSKLGLFEGVGVELEYMIVDKNSLNIKPITDLLFKKQCGKFESNVNRGRVGWSNELALHLVEIKNPDPVSRLSELKSLYQNEISFINKELEFFDAQLMPTGVHPWMNPQVETKLWPHENSEIYNTYDKLFDCKRHGWSNLQSMHLNISFDSDLEFRKIHSAIRLILPLIPGLSSSSPIINGILSENQSERVFHYLTNQKKISTIMGLCIPDVIFSKDEYKNKILNSIYKDINSLEGGNVLAHEWINSRGAIPKFDSGCLEIRLFDTQEAPYIDLAIAEFWILILKQLVFEKWSSLQQIESISTANLRAILDGVIREGENYLIMDGTYLSLFEIKKEITTKELISIIAEQISDLSNGLEIISKILKYGTLSTRIKKSAKLNSFKEIYAQLCHCLNEGSFFEG